MVSCFVWKLAYNICILVEFSKKVLNYIVCHESFSILPNTKYFKGYKCAYIFIRWTCVYTMVYDLRLCHFEVVMIMWKVFRMHAYIFNLYKMCGLVWIAGTYLCVLIFYGSNYYKFGKVGKNLAPQGPLIIV